MDDKCSSSCCPLACSKSLDMDMENYCPEISKDLIELFREVYQHAADDLQTANYKRPERTMMEHVSEANAAEAPDVTSWKDRPGTASTFPRQRGDVNPQWLLPPKPPTRGKPEGRRHPRYQKMSTGEQTSPSFIQPVPMFYPVPTQAQFSTIPQPQYLCVQPTQSWYPPTSNVPCMIPPNVMVRPSMPSMCPVQVQTPFNQAMLMNSSNPPVMQANICVPNRTPRMWY